MDTGSDRTVINSRIIPKKNWTGRTVVMIDISGRKKSYPTAEATIELDGDTYRVNVAVSADLPVDALLGQDIFLTKHLVTRANLEEKRELRQVLNNQLGLDRQLAVYVRRSVKRYRGIHTR